MAENSEISWCDSTFNPYIGCTKVSPGCKNCYAEALDHRWGNNSWGPGAPRRVTSSANWKKPLLWNRKAAAAGERHKVFCGSLCDVFDEEAPEGAWQWLLELILATPQLDWLLLTKRPERWRFYLDLGVSDGKRGLSDLPHNLWIGTTAENQEQADKRIPLLLEIPARVRFLSVEPMLGPVDLERWLSAYDANGEPSGPRCRPDGNSVIDWLICGGESGPKARPMHPDWARSLRDQCAEAGIPFHFKQHGAWAPDCWHSGPACRTTPRPTPGGVGVMFRCGKKRAGRKLDGKIWAEFPR